ncbi:hypothetical protein HX747_23270 [Streptomyces sp. L06]|nr:hypothetical protein [Streptomyces sp. L06]
MGWVELKVWYSAELTRRAFSVSLQLLCLITICAGGLLTVLADKRWDMATELLLPSYAFILFTVFYARLHLFADRRWLSSSYVQWAAVSTLIACQDQAGDGRATPLNPAQLIRKLETLGDALTLYAQFGFSRSPGVRSVLLGVFTTVTHRLESGFVACLRDRSRVPDLAEQVEGLIDALGRGEPLSVVSPGEAESVRSVSAEEAIPWRMVLGHFLVFIAGVGLILGFDALGIDAGYLPLLVPLLCVVVQIPFLVTGMVPTALRHPPRPAGPFTDAGTESESSTSGAGTAEDRPSALLPVSRESAESTGSVARGPQASD